MAGVQAVGATGNRLSHTHRWVAHHLRTTENDKKLGFFRHLPLVLETNVVAHASGRSRWIAPHTGVALGAQLVT